jgi:chromosome partitioning protein
MVDLDPQAALTAYWGLETEASQSTIYQLLLNDSVAVRDTILRVRDRIDVIPADIDLAAAEVELFSAMGRERILRDVLASVQEDYDFVLVDCPPNLGLLTVNALVACHRVIIPLQCEYFAMRGLSMLLDTLAKVKRRLNPQLDILGILPTLYNSRTRHAQEVLAEVRRMFGARVFDTTIHNSIRFAESSLAQQPILEYAPTHAGARAYRSLAKEVIDGTRSA